MNKLIKDSFIFWNILACILLASILLALLGPGANAVRRNFEGIEAGKIADRDIVAGKDVFYIDTEATRLRIEAEERLVLPVFQMDEQASLRITRQFQDFRNAFKDLVSDDVSAESSILMLQSKFPGIFSRSLLASLLSTPLKSQALVYTEDVLQSLLSTGIVLLPSEGLSTYNQDYYELRRLINNKIESEQRAFSSMITKQDVPEQINREISEKHLSRQLGGIVSGLVQTFAQENVFFDETASKARIKAVRNKVEPVKRAIGRNEILIRKGEMVTPETFARVQAIRSAASRADFGLVFGGLGLLVVAAFISVILLGQNVQPGGNGDRKIVLMALYSATLFFILILVAARLTTGQLPLESSYIIPISLFVGIGTAISGQTFGYTYSLILGLVSAPASNLNPHLLVFILLSGIFSSFMISISKTRLALVRASFFQALFQGLLTLVLLLPYAGKFQLVAGLSFLQALNGFLSGALILAILPVIEQGLNLPTRFRLLELSDVNAPALKELLTQAPGTYSHSLNVANLAEAGAEAIGANALLARVGAYYHDIGKIEQPEYFVENQKGVNKHDDINPRLSATVIRSHVKFGVEKAKALGLPKEVVEIVAEHHGDSVITWFYEKAKAEDETVRREDFSYPGEPPRSKEAGIVMIADTVEAATRTLKKPTVPRLEQQIRQLILDKVQAGQLDNCSLTIKDLESIRHAFTRILAGQFHSRIEYPRQKENG